MEVGGGRTVGLGHLQKPGPHPRDRSTLSLSFNKLSDNYVMFCSFTIWDLAVAGVCRKLTADVELLYSSFPASSFYKFAVFGIFGLSCEAKLGFEGPPLVRGVGEVKLEEE